MISIVIPALNEADSIGETVASVKQAIAGSELAEAEILVVDDGSSDGTGELASQAGARVVKHPHKAGYGLAVKAGIQNASHETIVIMDADLTYPPQAIPTLVDEYRRGHDLVIGARSGQHYNPTLFKGPLRAVLKFLVEFIAERPVPDVNSGLRVFNRETVKGYLPHLCDTFSFTTSQTLAYMLTGRFVGFVPIDYAERVGVTKVRMFRDSLKTLQYIVQAIIYYNPLKLFLLVTAACLMFSVLGFAVAFFTKIAAPYYLAVGGVLMSMLIFCLGLLADLLRQIMGK